MQTLYSLFFVQILSIQTHIHVESFAWQLHKTNPVNKCQKVKAVCQFCENIQTPASYSKPRCLPYAEASLSILQTSLDLILEWQDGNEESYPANKPGTGKDHHSNLKQGLRLTAEQISH